MHRKFDSTTLDLYVIRRALRASGPVETYFPEFTATWTGPLTKKKVDFSGTMGRDDISLETASIQDSDEVYDLRKIFTNSEMRAFNYVVNSARMRNAA